MHNIEKSGFHPGQYVGYGQGTVWRIRKMPHMPGWKAIPRDGDGVHHVHVAKTLREMSRLIEHGDSARDPRNRAKRGPHDEGMAIAKRIAKWSPAGGRMSPNAKLEWRENALRRALDDKGIPWRAAFRDVLVDAATKESHRSDRARYRRAYGS